MPEQGPFHLMAAAGADLPGLPAVRARGFFRLGGRTAE